MSYSDYIYADFEELEDKVISRIFNDEYETQLHESSAICFYTSNGDIYKMYHDQNCCESVSIEDICGDLEDIIGSPVLLAEKTSNSGGGTEYTEDENGEEYIGDKCSHTWTFYKLSTIKGSITIRWYGTSNGYYSEEVDFYRVIGEEKEALVEMLKNRMIEDLAELK